MELLILLCLALAGTPDPAPDPKPGPAPAAVVDDELTVELSPTEDEVPLGTKIYVEAAVSGGTPRYSRDWVREYGAGGPGNCGPEFPVVLYSHPQVFGQPPNPNPYLPGTVEDVVGQAGTHTYRCDAADSGFPTKTGSGEASAEGLPPDACQKVTGPGFATYNGIPTPAGNFHQWGENVKFEITAGGEEMGEYFSPFVQEIVECQKRDLATGRWENYQKLTGDKATQA